MIFKAWGARGEFAGDEKKFPIYMGNCHKNMFKM
jgi:hypothetical protein